MNITITLKPEVEKGLLAKARGRGLTLDAYLADLVHREVGFVTGTKGGAERAQAFVDWAKSHRPTKPLSEEAISRRTMYLDRD